MTMESPNNSPSTREGWIETALTEGDPSVWSKAEIARLLLVPTLVILLFAGSVYLVRRSWPAGSPDEGQPSMIQVRLIPRPDQAVIPIEPTSLAVTGRDTDVNSKSERTDTSSTQVDVERLPEKASSTVESRAPSISSISTLAAPAPNSALAKFQQTLIKHIAKFQHYPVAAHNKLQGTVETFFSIDRTGRVLGVWIKGSSGQTVLDAEAIQTIKRAEPLPSIPTGLPDRLNIQVQLAFDPT